MGAWVVWLVLAAAFGVAEAFTLTASLAVLGGAALLTAPVAAIGAPVVVQVVVFAVATVAGLVLLRPVARRHRTPPPERRFGIDALVGETARVVHDVTAHDGLVRLRGEDWTARSFDGAAVIPAGTTVDVLSISGTTAFVHPRSRP